MKKILLVLSTMFTISCFASDGDVTIFRRYKCDSKYTCLCYYTQAYMCPFGWQYSSKQESFSFDGEDEKKAEEFINQNLTCHYNYYVGEAKTNCSLLATLWVK